MTSVLADFAEAGPDGIFFPPALRGGRLSLRRAGACLRRPGRGDPHFGRGPSRVRVPRHAAVGGDLLRRAGVGPRLERQRRDRQERRGSARRLRRRVRRVLRVLRTGRTPTTLRRLLLGAIESVAVAEGDKLYVDRAALREAIAADGGIPGPRRQRSRATISGTAAPDASTSTTTRTPASPIPRNCRWSTGSSPEPFLLRGPPPQASSGTRRRQMDRIAQQNGSDQPGPSRRGRGRFRDEENPAPVPVGEPAEDPDRCMEATGYEVAGKVQRSKPAQVGRSAS